MILYSDRDDHYSQRVRIVLAEKDITCEIRESSLEETSEEILSINPYHKLPILVDRELGLINSCQFLWIIFPPFSFLGFDPKYPSTPEG